MTTSRTTRPHASHRADDPSVTLPPLPSSAAAARRFVRTAIVGAEVTAEGGVESGRLGLLDDALLLVSELVTNAVVHAGTDVVVSVVARPRSVHVRVSDSSAAGLLTRPESATATGGRGLALVEAYARTWGVDQELSGKSVWFELDAAQR